MYCGNAETWLCTEDSGFLFLNSKKYIFVYFIHYILYNLYTCEVYWQLSICDILHLPSVSILPKCYCLNNSHQYQRHTIYIYPN